MNFLNLVAVLATASLSAGSLSAATINADTVLAFENSGAGAGPSGDTPFGNGNVEVPFSHAFFEDGLFISLPTGSFIALGFSTGFIFDGAGDDLFIGEIGNGSERANIEVSSDFGTSFSFLTTANGNTVTSIDLADFSFTGTVNAVRVTGLDNGGSAPGFDLDFVRGLEGSVTEEPQGVSVVPLPASLSLLLAAVGGIGVLRRRKI